MLDQSEIDLRDRLQEKIKTLRGSIWERKADWPLVSSWLEQFSGHDATNAGTLQALYLLSNFMYFGTIEIRALLKSLFRDTFRASVIEELRDADPSLKMPAVEKAFQDELLKTRFVSLGNPSESSTFLLYYFRQEASIPRDCFISGAEIFQHAADGSFSIKDDTISRYVFIDDMCGSGQQGEMYSKETVLPLKALCPDVKVYYYAIFGLSNGIERLRSLQRFDQVHALVELDESFRCFSQESRIYRDVTAPISLEAGKVVAEDYGKKLIPTHPLGFNNGQLLLGFAYNTPDNTLPIIWSEGAHNQSWLPVFKRHAKLYVA